MRAVPIVIERHERRARRRLHVEYRFKQGRLRLASTVPTLDDAEALASSLARLLGVCLFYRPAGENGPARLLADYTRPTAVGAWRDRSLSQALEANRS
jgi:hypothetical protein